MNPALLQINTRAWLDERGRAIGRAAGLDDIEDESLVRIAADGYDFVWLLGVWQTGDAGRRVSLGQPEWRKEYREVLVDCRDADVCGSPFAIADYRANRDFGGPEALARMRARLAGLGIKLMLDFVPNHTALDHPWVREHPEYYIQGTEADLASEPQNYIRLGERIFAHGRDPYFPGWPDTAQLNYRHRGLREAMRDVLLSIERQCDAVRCDMAMLVLPDVIETTWRRRSLPGDGSSPVDEPFWPFAIDAVRAVRRDFVFMAEAYWDLEWTLQQQGFDYTYDKRLYDRLRALDATGVREHLHADPQYQAHSARFLENHDEPRAAAVFSPEVHDAAAAIALLSPGLHFIHDGQPTGRHLRMSNHLRRRAPEPVDRQRETFYARLVECLKRPEVRGGQWQILEPRPAWDGNPTHGQFVAYTWTRGASQVAVVANYAASPGQCYVTLPPAEGNGQGSVVMHDLLHPTRSYWQDSAEIRQRGLYLDLPAWSHHVFSVDAPGTAH